MYLVFFHELANIEGKSCPCSLATGLDLVVSRLDCFLDFAMNLFWTALGFDHVILRNLLRIFDQSTRVRQRSPRFAVAAQDA
jgi:hypothetical protein